MEPHRISFCRGVSSCVLPNCLGAAMGHVRPGTLPLSSAPFVFRYVHVPLWAVVTKL